MRSELIDVMFLECNYNVMTGKIIYKTKNM